VGVKTLPFMFPSIENVRCAFQCRAKQCSTSQGSTDAPDTPDTPDAPDTSDVLDVLDKSTESSLLQETRLAALSGGNISYVRKDSPEHVRACRAELTAHLGFSQVAEAQQVHGIVTIFDAPATSQAPDQILQEADGLATDVVGRALMIKTADCQPVLFAHASGQHIMALHVGWRGNRAQYIQKAVAAWCVAKNIQAQDIFAVRGPSLGPEKAEFIHFDAEWGAAYRQYFDTSTASMDLWRLTHDQLIEAGLLAQNIHGIELCTASLPMTFFSHRADALAGRQANFIWRTA